MKQIGARQEAGKMGGIGSCGRELCCSTWLTDFKSVNTNAARYQNLVSIKQNLVANAEDLNVVSIMNSTLILMHCNIFQTTQI